MDDAIGSVRPAALSLYTMSLNRDGTVVIRLNCNRATGSWSIQPGDDPSSGRFQFGPLAATRAVCSSPSLDERFVAHAAYVRSYLLKDGMLALSLMADGGVYLWKPDSAHQ
jgi:heat shock protein HslJ